MDLQSFRNLVTNAAALVERPENTGSNPDDTDAQRVAQMDVNEEDSAKYCWVCFGSDGEDAPTASWVQPCKCNGTTMWVHQLCIQRWVDEKQRGDQLRKVSCPQCGTEYLIVIPQPTSLGLILDYLDSISYRVSPFMAAGVILGSLYWTAASYGCVTVLQVMGYKDGLSLMEKTDPLVLLISLPTIPVILILSKFVHWEEYLVQFMQRQVASIPVLRSLVPPPEPCNETQLANSEMAEFADPISSSRVMCSALILPTASSLCGKIFFESVSSNLQRTLLGGLVFIGVKGILHIYRKQQLKLRQSQRRILDYPKKASCT